jgi:hypothetical protein
MFNNVIVKRKKGEKTLRFPRPENVTYLTCWFFCIDVGGTFTSLDSPGLLSSTSSFPSSISPPQDEFRRPECQGRTGDTL